MASGADRASADARSRRPCGNSEDRVSPPTQAAFSMVMLGSTRAGDAYHSLNTNACSVAAGLPKNELRRASGPQNVLISRK
jgi:hypothetical protein